jgi:peptidoglycan/LPS O-acetylase OafA/YrhL
MPIKKLFQDRNAGALAVAGRYYRPELDVVRFLAFLLVFFDHTLPSNNHHDPRVDHLLGGFAHGFYSSVNATRYGLSLFFTLSAFLICELLLRERNISCTVGVKQFYIRRILRIWPLYYLALALGVVFAFFTGGDSSSLISIGWFAIFMGAWHSSLYGFIANPVVPLWSISVEEQFYLFAPWVVKYFNRKLLYGFCALLIFVASAELYRLDREGVATWFRVWADSLVQFSCFAAGILLCLFLHGRAPRIAAWQRLILIFSWCVCWAAACYFLHYRFVYESNNSSSWPLIASYAFVPLGSVLLLLAFIGIDTKLLPRWAIYLGRISYGLYVYHEFVLTLVHYLHLERLNIHKIPIYTLRVILAAGLELGLPFGLTILVASLSYRYFETPFLKMKKRHAVIESEPVGAHIDL